MKPLLISGATVVTEAEAHVADIRVEDGRIAQIGEKLSGDGCETLDARGLVALPGAVDSHVHFHMQTSAGGRNADDFTVGSACAVLGGTTTVVDFASPVEGKSFEGALLARRAEADGRVYTDYALHMEVTGAFDEPLSGLDALPALGVKGLKIYTTYGTEQYPREKLPALFKKAATLGMVMLAHCEDDEIVMDTKARFLGEGKTAACWHAASRPASAEEKAAGEIIALAEQAELPLIVAHISTAGAARLVAEARSRGARVYGETCPHYLLLTDACYLRPEPQRYIMTPPLRTPSDNAALWQAVEKGDIGLISTDHCPFTLPDKLRCKGCFEAIPGIGGVQSMPALLFSEGYQKGRLMLPQLAGRIATEAAKRYGLYPQKGVLAEGADADITLFDPNAKQLLTAAAEHSNAGYTVFEGMPVGCRVTHTFLRGVLTAHNGALCGAAAGRYV